MSPLYNCFDVSKEFLRLAREDGEIVSPMKLLKMTYIANGYYLAFYNKSLFDNDIQAWQFGPVIPDLYHVIKRFGAGNVNHEIIELYSREDLDAEAKNFLKLVWNAYKKYSGVELSGMTHTDDSPWKKVFDGSFHKTIDHSIIKDHYIKVINDRRQK